MSCDVRPRSADAAHGRSKPPVANVCVRANVLGCFTPGRRRTKHELPAHPSCATSRSRSAPPQWRRPRVPCAGRSGRWEKRSVGRWRPPVALARPPSALNGLGSIAVSQRVPEEDHLPAPALEDRPRRTGELAAAGCPPSSAHEPRAERHRLRGHAAAPPATAGLCAAACARPEDDGVLRFWAMGREGEVATQLLGAFERENPGLRVRVEQLPWSAAHEKLLTAFAGDATPDIAQMGNTWLAGARRAGGARAAGREDPRVAGRSISADYDPGVLDTNLVDGRQYGVPWYVDTRVLFYRRDLLARAGYAEPPRDWDEWTRMLVAIKQQRGPGALRAAPAAQRVRAHGGALAAAGRAVAARRRPLGKLPQPGLRTHPAVLPVDVSSAGWRRRSRTTRSPTSGTSSPAAPSASTSPAPGRWASSRGDCLPLSSRPG